MSSGAAAHRRAPRGFARLAVVGIAMVALLAPRRAPAQWYSYAFSITNPTGQSAIYQDTEFGAVVAAMGHDLLVTSFADTAVGPNPGAVYLFQGDTGAVLKTFGNPVSLGVAQGSFGRSLATVGRTVAIGSPFEPAGGDQVGAVYLFDADTGALIHRVTDPSPSYSAQESFGLALAIVDGMIAVGAPRKEIAGRNRGAVFIVDPQTGAVVRTLLNPVLPPPVSYSFGLSLAALGENLVVGADQELHLIDPVTGAVRQSFPTPTPQDVNLTRFGQYVDALGDHPVAGDPGGPGGGQEGVIYVFDSVSGALVLTVQNPDPGTFHFGYPFAVVGGELLARPNDPTKDRVVLLDGGSAAVRQTLFNPGVYPVSDDRFGAAVAATDTGFVVAAPGYGPRSTRNVGAVYVYDACGNGVRTGGEQCDDGNLVAGDGCSPTCTLELCGPTPAAGCRTVPTHRSTLVIGDNFKDAQDVVSWKWSQGQQTQPGDFGNPLATTNYVLCVYDGSAAPQPVKVSAALAGTTWTAPLPTFFKYDNPARTPSGLFSAALHAGPDGNASITVKGKGARVEPPGLPLTLPVTVRLRNSDTSTCWTATYGSTVVVNNGKKFRALSD